jgi:hypothetical protein
VWTLAGDLIINKADPYLATDGLFKSGTVSALLIQIASMLFGQFGSLFLLTSFLINILGVLILMRTLGVNGVHENLLLTGFIILCSPFREIFVNGQLTGVIYGGIGIIYLRLIKNSKMNTFELFALATLIVFLVDLKPNLTFFPIAFIILFSKKYLVGTLSTILFAIYHFVINLYVGTFLEKSWVETLLNLNSTDSNPNLFGSISIWQIVNLTSSGPVTKMTLDIAPTLVFIIINLLVLFFVHKWPAEFCISLSFISSFFLSYSHFYSYLPILAICFLLCIRRRWWVGLGFFASLFFVSFEPMNNLGLASLGVFVLIFALSNKSLSVGDIKLLIFGWVSSLILRIVIIDSVNQELLAKSVLASIPLVWLLITYTTQREAFVEDRQ